MNRKYAWLVLLAIVFLATAAICQQTEELDPDEEGCKDSKIINRMPGCRISRCETKEFDEASLQIGKPADDADPKAHKVLEGAIEIISYECPSNITTLNIVRNAEAALKAAGFSVVYMGRAWDESRVLTARKGNQWMQVFGGYGFTDAGGYVQTSVKVKEMEQVLEANADALETEINRSGRVAVYGINFDTGKATLRPDSDKPLGEVLSLLKKNPDWKLKVEGHTDNVGAKAMNQKLSEQRAASVVAWLTGKGIAAARLTSAGLGDSKPLEPNTTDEGKAKNRRVELVKQ